MRNCLNCGQMNPDGQFACSRCGTQIAAPHNFGSVGQNQFGQNQPNFNQPMPQQAKKKMGCGKIALLVGVPLVVVGLIIAGIIGYLVTQTLQWKITEKWRLESVTLAGTTTPVPAGTQETTMKFNWDQTYVQNLANGKTESGTYRVIDEKTIEMKSAGKDTVNFDVTIDGKTMTVATSKEKLNISMKYVETK